MESLHESDVVTSRFWGNLLQLAPRKEPDVGLTYRHALFILFLYAVSEQERLNDSIIYNLRSNLSPSSFNSAEYKGLLEGSIYSWLMSAPQQTYSNRANEVYIAMLKTFRRDRLPGLQFALGTEWITEQAAYIRKWLESENRAQILHTFDRGQNELVKQRFDVERESFAANLAAACTTKAFLQIGDFFGQTAQFPKLIANQQSSAIRCALGRHELYDETVDMRMHMQGITFSYFERPVRYGDEYHSWQFHLDFLLLNPTPREGGIRASRPSNASAKFTFPSAIEIIDNLVHEKADFRLALVVVPHADCNSTQWPLTVRRNLVEMGRIAAVIDFPRSASDKRKRFSAWLVRGNKNSAYNPSAEILFIDAEPLSLLTSANESGPSTQFIGALIAGVLEDTETQFDLIDRLESTEPLLARVFSREFAPGWNDAPGLSRLVPFDEVVQKNFVLSAKAYLDTGTSGIWTQGMDKHLLDELLNRDGRRGKRMYIIGNNGEGKSLLLRDIAGSSVERGRRTIAISFGTSDRFPKTMRGRGSSLYRYRGARTSSTGVNNQQTAVEAGRLMLDIYSDSVRLRVFEELSHLIGFTSQQFLIPKELKHNSHPDVGLVSGIVRLASQDSDDRLRIKKLQQSPDLVKKYKLGLRRHKGKDGIVPFDELSSGEQQIILLAAKMASDAEHDVLFLVDEPEISLHVGWQRVLPKVFSAIATNFGADILVATHSPVVIASADESLDYCFTIMDRKVVSLPREERQSVETALFEGFRTYTNNNREVHERCASLVADYIDSANQENFNGAPEEIYLEKLKEMKKLVEEQSRFHDQDNIAFDISLIERAQAAIEEIARFNSGNPPARGGE